MERLRNLRLLDERGHPLAPHVERVLVRLVPRLRKRFPTVRDDVDVVQLLEETGRRMLDRERRLGPIEKPYGYAWVTLRNLTTSWLRRHRVEQQTVTTDDAHALLASVPAAHGGADEIEREILLGEVMARLSRDERLVLGWKRAGFASEEIAHFRGTSANAVDIVFSRAKRKIQRSLRVQQNESDSNRTTGSQGEPAAPRPVRDEVTGERRDDTRASAAGSIRLQLRGRDRRGLRVRKSESGAGGLPSS